MEFLGTALRWLQLTSGLVLLGSFSLLLLVGPGRSPDAARWRAAVSAAAPWLVALLLTTAAGLLLLQVASVSGGGEAVFQWSEWARLLERTRYGAVWQARQATALTLLLLLLGRGPLIVRFGERIVDIALLTLALLINAAAVFTGHGAATEPLWLAGAGHAVHLLAAGVWAGGLPALAYGFHLAARGRDPLFRQTFLGVVRRFSVLATVCVALIVASGALIAYLQFGAPTRWPARTDDIFGGLMTVLERSLAPLLGTSFGLQVLAKMVLLVPVLFVAARVRWLWMPRMGKVAFEQSLAWQGAAGLLRVELGVVLLILLFAAGLTGTLPAAHDQMVWPLPFRLSLAATWDKPGVATTVAGASLMALGGLAWLVHAFVPGGRARAAQGGRRIRWGAAVLATLAGLAIVLYALSVDAYPDTYRRTDVSYNAVSVTRGAALYSQHCVSCHGPGGKGDGPLATRLPTRPANLTEPHTALHTAGDLFWWLTHGKPKTAMPGFAQKMSDEERWDMVNFLRAFSAGFQARILTPQVVPGRPWLGPPDFDFVTQSGLVGALKEYRERKSVLLVFYSQPFSAQRLAELAHLYPHLQSGGAEVIAIALPGAPSSPSLPFTIVTDGAQEAATAYLLFRRTLSDPGTAVLGEPPSHMEFLIDRFGYVRARWLPQEDGGGEGWRDTQFLLDQIERINREPRILAPPDDHVH